MVIITDRNGQLGNRLFHFSYFIANAIEHNYKVIYPCFDPYDPFFEATSKNSFFQLPISTKVTPVRLLDRILLKLFQRYPGMLSAFYFLDVRNHSTEEVYDLNNSAYQELVHTQTVLVKGWMFRDEVNLKKYRDVLQKIFTPIPFYALAVKQIIGNLRKDNDCIIGIHIRRRDYKTWNDGRYYFTDEIYLEKMHEVNSFFARKGEKCCFFIASNEVIDQRHFNHLQTDINNRDLITDLYALAACDYIMGPPSTYSYWASFYGNTPLFVMETPTCRPKMKDFKIY